jgi:hypothetical protein
MMKVRHSTTGASRTLVFGAVLLALLGPAAARAEEHPAEVPAEAQTAASDQQGPEEGFRRFQFNFEPDAYYTDVQLTIALTREPIPHLGERPEEEIYRRLLAEAFAPRFFLIEASINPLPYLGVYTKKNHPHFYRDAELSGSFNWVKALTAGFEEPWAASLFAGTVVDFDIPGSRETAGRGYSGYLYSTGNYHIKDNALIKDDWWEIEWKLKGDRKSPVKKLNWSFRVGAKLHANPDITDIMYLSFRRSRVDYRSEHDSLFTNSGFEYTYDMNRRGLHAIRHYFTVDKKWPYPDRRMAFSLALGFVWESKDKYAGPLADGRTSDDFQVILRPNIEF